MRRSHKRRRWPINGFPKSTAAKLRYTEQISINVGDTVATNYVFRANDCYDPNYTSGGHQPRGFDRFIQMYNHFNVQGSKITVQYADPGGYNVPPAYVDVHVTDQPSLVVGSHIDLFEANQGRGFPQQIGTERNYVGFNPRISRKFSAKRFFGVSTMGKSQYQGTASSSPTELAYYQIILCPIAGNDPPPLTFIVQIEFLVVFTEPRYETAS